jgi:hypothetical protein
MSLHYLDFSAVVLLELFREEKETLHYNESTLSDRIQKVSADSRLSEGGSAEQVWVKFTGAFR